MPRWIAKDFKFRGPFSFLFLAFFIGLFTLLAHAISSNPDPGREILGGLSVGLILLVATVFVVNTANTLKGYAALMAKEPNEDGSVSDPKMLDGIKGKLKEVLLEAGPQSNLQVKFLQQYLIVKSSSFRFTFSSRLGFTLGTKLLVQPFLWSR